MNVLVIACHPDDEILGLGGTLARHAKAGDKVYPVVFVEGATVRYGGTEVESLESCCQKSCSRLGIEPPEFLRLPDQRLDTIPQIELNRYIEERIRRHQPEVIYGHHPGDVNRDHQVLSEATMVASRPKPGQVVKRLLTYQVPSSTEWIPQIVGRVFMPNWFVDITDTVDQKLEAMACYKSETPPFPHPRSLEAIRTQGRYWGQSVGFEYAEAFMLLRNLQ
jgi:LmbE family N-acetylglucosaminyl deacetylase